MKRKNICYKILKNDSATEHLTFSGKPRMPGVHGVKVLEHQSIDSDRQKQLSDIIPTAFDLKRTLPLGYRRYLEENTLTTIKGLHVATRQWAHARYESWRHILSKPQKVYFNCATAWWEFLSISYFFASNNFTTDVSLYESATKSWSQVG